MRVRALAFVLPVLLLGCFSSDVGGEFEATPTPEPEEEWGYQIVLETARFSATKPDGRPWDGIDGQPDPCVLVWSGWDSYMDMSQIAWDEMSATWYESFQYSVFTYDQLGDVHFIVNDEDPPGEDDDGDSGPNDDDGDGDKDEEGEVPDDDDCDEVEEDWAVDLQPPDEDDMGVTFTLVPASANGLEEMVVRVEKVLLETW